VEEPDLIDLFVIPLEENGMEDYMVSGSIASIEYGEPRATLDIDIALFLPENRSRELLDLYPDSDFYCPPVEVLEAELKRPNRGHFNIIHTSSGLKAHFYPSRNHPYLGWALKHRKRILYKSTSFWLAPPEYVILWELEFFREGGGDKHLRDIRGMLDISGEVIDQSLIDEAAGELRLRKEWNAVLE
jgi:hypothetical protein